MRKKNIIDLTNNPPDTGDNGDAGLGNSGLKPRASQRVHYIFTFNNYEEDDILLLETFLKEICISYCFQKEIAPTTGTPHLQGVVTLKKRARISEILYAGIHWDDREPVKHVAKAYQYASKLDTRASNSTPFTYNYTPSKELILLNIEDFYPWQIDILKLISENPDDRSIYWYYEEDGCRGKTALAKYICAKFNAICVSGKSNDCKFAIVAYNKIKGLYPDIIIYNVPRCNHDYISYEGMESIKDGFFFSGKYESCQVMFNSPHIIVFANDEPDFNKLSSDRWKVKKI